MKKLFRELNLYFSFYIFIKTLLWIMVGLNILKITKYTVPVYSSSLLSVGIIYFLSKEKPKLIMPSKKELKQIIPIFIISLFVSFFLLLVLNKSNIFNKEIYNHNKFLFIIAIPIFQGFYYRKILLSQLLKRYGKNASILIMIFLFFLFENQSLIRVPFVLMWFPIILGYLYLEKINLIATVILHILYNFLIFYFISYISFIKIPRSTLFLLIITLFLFIFLELKKIKRIYN